MKKSSTKPSSSIISEELLDLSGNNEIVETNSLVTDETAEKVAVRITAKNVNRLLPTLEETYNFEVIASSPEHHFVEGFIPTDNISALTSLTRKGLFGVLPVIEPTTNVGNVTSQADFVHESDRVRNLPSGYDGTGVTIGIMSDSYDNLGGAAGGVISGDLPADGVNVLQDYTQEDSEGNTITGNGSDEGRGMAELIHDLAPGSDLAFSSVFFGEADFAQQIRDLADPTKGDADILVDDVSYGYEPYFQDGVIAQAVDEVVNDHGVTYFTSAGNLASKSFESDEISFVDDSTVDGSDSTLDGLVTYPGTYYDFDTSEAGVDPIQEIGLSNSQTIKFVLQWDDPFYTTDGVDTDLDLYLLDNSNNIVARAASTNTATQTPVEYLEYQDPRTIEYNEDGDATNLSTETYKLVIVNYGGSPDPGIIKYINRGDVPESVEYAHDASTVVGHSAATNAQAVAAVPWYDQENAESFTSKGSTTIAFEADGTPLAAPVVRQTPDIAAIDGTNTSFFGGDISLDADSFPNFFGTSAAAPHAAAIAALLQESDPSLTPEEIYSKLQTTAKDIEDSGFDDLTGHGLINAYDAIYGAPVSSTLNFSDNFESGALGAAYATNSTGAGRIQVTAENDPIDGYHLTLDGASLGISSLNEVILNFDASNASNIQLSFDQKEYGDEDHPMSASFTDSENSDGVSLSVDGTVWHRLVSLTGSDSTETYQTHSFDLSTFASDNSLTLDGEVQIKFQQFDDFGIASDGMAFDNIAITADLNNTPTVANAIEDQVAQIGSPFSFQFAVDTFNDADGDDLIYTAALADGSNLPSWLDFDDTNRTFSSNTNPTSSDLSLLQVKVTASDSLDSVSDIFTLAVVDSVVDDTQEHSGTSGGDGIAGGTGKDTVRGGEGGDSIAGGKGGDRLFGDAGADNLDGGEDQDFMQGGIGNDTISGGDGDDVLIGGTGDDSISGGDGNDILIGGTGDDFLDGGNGSDKMIGGADADTFVINAGDTDNLIFNYEDAIDMISLDTGLTFADLTIVDNGLNTGANISETSSGDLLVTVLGIDETNLTSADFI